MDKKSLHVRHAHKEDLPALLELYQHLTPDDAMPAPGVADDIFERFKAYAGSVILVGEIDGILVATCSLVVVPNLTRGGSPYGLIENVVTHNEFQRLGFGKMVLRSATDAAWEAGCYKVMLMTGSKKPETINFYLSAGFEQSKTGFQQRRIAARLEA
jgi:GNAT superfamily N-acetyltransferase